jgi:hypothetical protein
MNDGLTSSKVTGSPSDVLVHLVFNVRYNSKLRKKNLECHRDRFERATAEMDIATIFHEALPELGLDDKNLTLEKSGSMW